MPSSKRRQGAAVNMNSNVSYSMVPMGRPAWFAAPIRSLVDVALSARMERSTSTLCTVLCFPVHHPPPQSPITSDESTSSTDPSGIYSSVTGLRDGDHKAKASISRKQSNWD